MVKEKTPSLDADGTKLSGIHSYHHEQGKRKRQAKHLLSGGIAGAVSRTCVSPLERVKILFQVQYIYTGSMNIVLVYPGLPWSEWHD